MFCQHSKYKFLGRSGGKSFGFYLYIPGVVLAQSNTKYRDELMDSKEAQECIHDDETIFKTTLQIVSYPVILLYQWILLPMSRSSYGRSVT